MPNNDIDSYLIDLTQFDENNHDNLDGFLHNLSNMLYNIKHICHTEQEKKVLIRNLFNYITIHKNIFLSGEVDDYDDSSINPYIRFTEVVKNKLNEFYFEYNWDEARIFYRNIFDEDLEE